MHRLIRRFVTLAFVAYSTIAVAAPVTVPNTFTAGTPAKAADVNANFQALVTAINTLSARVDKLDGTTAITAADVVGTYTMNGLMVQVFKGPQAAGTPGVTYDTAGSGAVSGTVTINADGTGSVSPISINFSQMDMPEYDPMNPASVANVTSGITTAPGENFTWTLTGNTITSSTGMSMRLQPGAQVIAGTKTDATNGLNVVFVLTHN